MSGIVILGGAEAARILEERLRKYSWLIYVAFSVAGDRHINVHVKEDNEEVRKAVPAKFKGFSVKIIKDRPVEPH